MRVKLDRVNADLCSAFGNTSLKIHSFGNRFLRFFPFMRFHGGFFAAYCHKSSARTGDIHIEHVSKGFGGKAVLRDFSFCLERGKIYCLMGRSGGGKTTLLRLLLGLEMPDAGTIVGMDGMKTGVVFQEDRLVSFLDGVGNVNIVGERQSRGQAEALLGELLAKEELVCIANHMSGGMKRRTALARALAFPSDVLLLDEPFAGLDEEARRRALDAIVRWQKGRTVVLVTHDGEDVEWLGGEVVRVEDIG